MCVFFGIIIGNGNRFSQLQRQRQRQGLRHFRLLDSHRSMHYMRVGFSTHTLICIFIYTYIFMCICFTQRVFVNDFSRLV